MHLVKLEAIQLDGEVARVADGHLLLQGKVRHDGTEVDLRSAEVKARFNAFAATHQCRAATTVCNAQHHATLVLPLYTTIIFTHSVQVHTTLTDYIGGMAQWLERRSWRANFPCTALDLQLMGDHLCG